MSTTSRPDSGEVGFTCRLLDTRSLWPGDSIQDAAGPVLLLLGEDAGPILKKRRMVDARMALGSALLKRWFVLRHLVDGGDPESLPKPPIEMVTIERRHDPVHGKPIGRLPPGWTDRSVTFDFNISHQAGIVALVGVTVRQTDPTKSSLFPPSSTLSRRLDHPGSSVPVLDGSDDPATCPVQVGVDVVCVDENEGGKESKIRTDFGGWVDMFESFFSARNRADMKAFSPDSVDLRIRNFYAHVAYKEAVLKMTGEGLLSSWLDSLEFGSVVFPPPASVVPVDGKTLDEKDQARGTNLHNDRASQLRIGDTVVQTKALMCGFDYDMAFLSLTSVGDSLMVATAVSPTQSAVRPDGFPKFEQICLDEIMSGLGCR